ncbi:holo-ACP synthase [Paenibacillus cymbidii]|uniref:holo-ACP synthase n=1 Tax=Paenibacillus cymbidii TaxID=1639034 RepID=UPI0010800737|nr:holo-ACP synthase [Paenibacillus cymbidii]
MIIGIGTDLADLPRIADLLALPAGRRFMERILAPEERLLAEQRKARLVEFVAGRFAAKEAVSKAFGCGIGRQIGFHDMIVTNDDSGKPVCTVSAAALERLGLADGVRIHLSITHTGGMAGAFAVVEDIGGRR